MLATLVNEPVNEEGWVYEMKWNGYRAVAFSQFTLGNMPARLKSEGDIFKGVLGKGINMQKAIKKIESLYGDLLNRAA